MRLKGDHERALVAGPLREMAGVRAQINDQTALVDFEVPLVFARFRIGLGVRVDLFDFSHGVVYAVSRVRASFPDPAARSLPPNVACGSEGCGQGDPSSRKATLTDGLSRRTIV